MIAALLGLTNQLKNKQINYTYIIDILNLKKTNQFFINFRLYSLSVQRYIILKNTGGLFT